MQPITESLCRDVHSGTSQIIIKMPRYRRAYRRVSKTYDGFFMIFQPVQIALQKPHGSHNHHCMQRPESCGLHDSIDILLPRSSWNQISRLRKQIKRNALAMKPAWFCRTGLGGFPVTMQVK